MGNRWTGLVVGIVVAMVSSSTAVKAQPCVLPDNGSGTVTLPPAGCGYLSPDDVHQLLVGLPVGTSIQLAAEHEFFFCHTCIGGPNNGQPCVPGGVGCPAPGVCTDGNSTCSIPTTDKCERQGGSMGGEIECAESTLTLDMQGTGSLSGYSRIVSMPVEFETHVGPRIPGQPVQSFDTDMFRLQGQLPPGDPDFDLLRIRGGTDFGMPSPGHTTLTRQGPPGSPFHIDSFFDVFYEIEFIGSPGGPFGGMSGSTTGTIRMQTGGPFGACCDSTGICQITTQAQCPPPSTYHGDGILCTPSPCFGPACGDGSCDSVATGENSCTCPQDCGPQTTSETGLCTDGSDNDCDGNVDCVDSPDCDTDPACGGPPLCPQPPPPTAQVKCPANLQVTDCVIDSVNDFQCLVEAVSFTAAGGPNIEQCACFPDNPGCGPVHIVPLPGGIFDIRCPGPCPPGLKCYVHFDDGTGTGPESQGKDFMSSVDIPPGVQVTCDCAPPPDPHRSADGTSVTFDTATSEVPTIPGGFFYPGSQPFSGTVNLQPGPIDTLIQRSAAIICPCAGLPPCPCDPIEIEMVALNLVSVSPITVNGPPITQWNVAVGLSVQPQPEPPGPMQATKTHANGGVFNAEIRILPRLTFTEVGNPGNTRTIDYGLPPVRPPIRVNFNNVPWVVNLAPHLVGTIAAPSDGNFVPGVHQPNPNPNSQVVVTAFGISKGGGVNHPVDPVPLCPLPGPAPDPCAPFQARDCAQTTPGSVCVPTVIQWVQGTPPQVVACGCRETNECHVGSNAAGPNCVNTCPNPALECTLFGSDTDFDGVDDRFTCDCVQASVCEPNSTGTDCEPVTCPDTGTGVVDTCQKKCAILDPLTGDVTLSDCDCVGPNDCHMEIATPAGAANTAGPGPSGNCVAVDDGTGTVKLPPDGCPYLSPDEFHKLYDGLPPGVTIEIGAIHKNFICNRQSDFCSFPIPPGVDCDDEQPNDPTDGAKECHDSTLELKLRGDMAGNAAGPSTYSRDLNLPVSFETHTGPRTPGMPVQSFDTDMFRLQGEITGDPDFDLLRIRAGTDFGMPSPGHTTLTKLPGGPNWAVDSFFDVFYEIEFTGAPGGPFGGMHGSTTGTIRMQTNAYKCVGDCPPDTDCVETHTTLTDGTVKICCECEPQPPQVCQPLPDGSGCTDTNCPCFGECIGGSYCDDSACCLDPNNCPVCYAPNSQESIKLCGDCFGECIGGSYCESALPGCQVDPGFPVCFIPNHHYSIYLCGGCFGSCQDGKYCDHPNPDCCLDPGNCQCYPATHPNSIKMCGGLDKCKPKCVKYNQLTGQVTVEDCECVGEECYVKIGNPVVTAGPGAACEVADNGGGSVDLPPAGCEYLTADEVHKIIDGLPAGTEIHLAPIHKDFICHKGQQGVCSFLDVDCKEDGGNLGGEKECTDSTLEFQLTGTGSLAGWNRIVTIPNTSFETHIGKKKPFEPVQSFPTELVKLQGQFTNPGAGDPDFDLLRITAGSGFGMPSPGHTTLTKLPSGPNWAVDSYFDISYRIDFVGTGPRLGGMSGSTTGTIRMATPTKFKCSTDCPAGQVCVQTTTQPTPPDGTMTVCCDCVDAAICEPKLDKKSCTNNTCPPGVICKPKRIRCYPAPDPRGCEIEECDCIDGDPCHPELPAACACNGDVTPPFSPPAPPGTQPSFADIGCVSSCRDGNCSCCVNSCDVNCDGTVNQADVDAVQCLFGGGSGCCPAASSVPVCTGACPAPSPPNKCVRKKQPVPGQNAVFDYTCRCVPVHNPPVAADTSVPGKNRYLSVAYDGTPANTAGPGVLLAMRVRLTDLQNPIPPNLPANPPPNFSAYEEATCTAPDEAGSCERWAGTPHTFLESQDLPARGTYRASRLQCSPAYFDWSLETNVNVTGAEIVPSSRYAAQFVDISCADTLDEECFSEVLVLGTARSGDVEDDFNPPATTTQPDVIDVAQLVNKFKSLVGALPKSIAQMQPNAPEPNSDLNALDIVAVVDAVKQRAYAYSGPCPCPSLMTCQTTACASDAVCVALPLASGGGPAAKCVKTCVGGDYHGEPCIDNTHGHCPGGGVCGNGGMNPGFCRDRCARCKP